MEKIKVYFFLIIILLVQFGSTGFTYYVNTCSASDITTITRHYIGCRCNQEIVDWNKHESHETKFTEKCCSSVECFVQTAEDYPTSAIQLQGFQLEGIVSAPLIVQIKEFHAHTGVVVNYKCNSPPKRNIDTRIFIQSFVI